MVGARLAEMMLIHAPLVVMQIRVRPLLRGTEIDGRVAVQGDLREWPLVMWGAHPLRAAAAHRGIAAALALLSLSCGPARVTDLLLRCTGWSQGIAVGSPGPTVVARDVVWATADRVGAYLLYRSGQSLHVRRTATGEERVLDLAEDVYTFVGAVEESRFLAFYSDRSQGLQEYVLVDAERCEWRALGIVVSTTDPVVGYSKVSAVSLDGGRVFYAIFRGAHAAAQEYLLDLGDSSVRAADASAHLVTEARLDGERVAWLQQGADGVTPGVAVWSAAEGRLLTVDLPYEARPRGLALSGTRAVWTDSRNVFTTPANTDIYMLDAATGTVSRLTTDGATHEQPSILGHLVAWSDKRSGNFDVLVRDLDTGEERVVAGTPESERAPLLTASGIFWQVPGPGGATVWLDSSVRP